MERVEASRERTHHNEWKRQTETGQLVNKTRQTKERKNYKEGTD